jgi:hypothetical protein
VQLHLCFLLYFQALAKRNHNHECRIPKNFKKLKIRPNPNHAMGNREMTQMSQNDSKDLKFKGGLINLIIRLSSIPILSTGKASKGP